MYLTILNTYNIDMVDYITVNYEWYIIILNKKCVFFFFSYPSFLYFTFIFLPILCCNLYIFNLDRNNLDGVHVFQHYTSYRL